MAIPWPEIQTEWGHRRYVAARRAIAARGGLAVDRLDDLLFAADSPTGEDALGVMRTAFEEAGSAPDAPESELLLALYVYGRCLEKWEKTEDYDRIRLVLGALDDVVKRADGLLLPIVVSQAQVMSKAMRVEDAMSCSCPVAMSERAKSIVTDLVELQRELTLADGPAELREVVLSDAETSRRYYETIDTVATEVLAFVRLDELDAPSRADFDYRPVLTALEAAEGHESIKGDVYESELRAHRVAVEALRDHADKPHLRFGAADVTYLYPFALEGLEGAEIDPAATVDSALGGEAEGLAERGLRPRELELNDLWDRPDVPEPGYSGASIELPPIEVTTTAHEKLEFTAEVRLSRRGNHHLLVRSQLENAGLHEVNQALRRGSHGMGDETFEGMESTTFPRYAEEIIGTIATALDGVPVVSPTAPYHVVLAARSISVQQPDNSTSPATPAKLRKAVGASLLFHPVRHLATSLEEWIRYPRPTVTNLLEGQGYAGDLVVRTDNTTVMYMPASPEWLAAEYEEMIEFVAAIPPLLTLWERRVLHLAAELDEALSQLERRVQTNDDPIDELQEQETRIRWLESDIRGQLAFLRSPALCRTRGQRRFLDDLWTAAGLPALESELDRRLTLLAERQERIATLAASIDSRSRRKQQERANRLEREQRTRAERLEGQQRKRAERLAIVLGLLGIASLAGVFDWINQVFGVGGRSWAWAEAIVFGAAVLTLGMYSFITLVYGRSRLSASSTEVVACRDLDVDLDVELLERFHREVLAVSFSPDELDDVETIARGLRGDGDANVLASVAIGRDGAVVGGIVGEIYAQEQVLLLAYLAVRPDLRGRGIGTALMEHVAPRWYAHPAVRLCVGEVHDPRVWSDIEGDDPLSRLRLYERLGARVLGVPFVQPSLVAGRARIPGFLLLAFHVDPGIQVEVDGRSAVRADIVGGFVRRYYETAEDARAPYDPELAGLLERIAENALIPLLPVADYERVPLLA